MKKRRRHRENRQRGDFFAVVRRHDAAFVVAMKAISGTESIDDLRRTLGLARNYLAEVNLSPAHRVSLLAPGDVHAAGEALRECLQLTVNGLELYMAGRLSEKDSDKAEAIAVIVDAADLYVKAMALIPKIG